MVFYNSHILQIRLLNKLRLNSRDKIRIKYERKSYWNLFLKIIYLRKIYNYF
jgi:hypothetical protein